MMTRKYEAAQALDGKRERLWVSERGGGLYDVCSVIERLCDSFLLLVARRMKSTYHITTSTSAARQVWVPTLPR